MTCSRSLPMYYADGLKILGADVTVAGLVAPPYAAVTLYSSFEIVPHIPQRFLAEDADDAFALLSRKRITAFEAMAEPLAGASFHIRHFRPGLGFRNC